MDTPVPATCRRQRCPVAAQLDVHRDLVLHGREAGDVRLVLRARPRLDPHALEVQGAIAVLDRNLIEVDRLVAGHQPVQLALGDKVQEASTRYGSEAVRRLYRRRRVTAAFAAGANQLAAGSGQCQFFAGDMQSDGQVHCWSSARIPPLITAEPTNMPFVS